MPDKTAERRKKYFEHSENVKVALKVISDYIDKDDDIVRIRQLRTWKKYVYMWSGLKNLWWSNTAHDWRVFEEPVEGSDDQSYYDKNINVFRAYLESIIAAMSATVPGVKCLPDDANNVNDVLTAKGGTKIGQLIYKHVDAPLLWAKGLYIYCTQGLIAAYNYTDYSEKYGFVDTADYSNVEESQSIYQCPSCGKPLDDLNFQIAIQKEIQESDEFDPDEDDVLLHKVMNDGQVICEQCQENIDPELKQNKVVVERMTGVTRKPKARQCIDVMGGLYVKVPNYARNQAECPYLDYSYETHYSYVYEKYPWLRRELKEVETSSDTSGDTLYARWARLSPQYNNEYPLDTPTCHNKWIRPSLFEIIPDEECRKELYKKFPDGCKVVFVNSEFASACNESMDDHWTLSKNPLSESIHYDPHGALVESIQEITDDLIALTLQTIEQGIPQTFADPSVLNFKSYRKAEVNPGDIFPAKPKSGKSIADGFYEVKTATLSQEVGPFGDKVQQLGQFTSGAMPSLFGGDQDNSSRTASQYAMSRAQSLQRLQTPWKMITFWWKDIFAKVIPAYIKNMMDDERIVQQQGSKWINIIIKKAEMDGKIGDVELEAADDLPMTTAQVRDLVMQLMNMQNSVVMEALTIPENLPYLYQAGGLNDMTIPGEDDRQKQLEEIDLLLQSQPIPNIGPDGMPTEQTSVMPELLVDRHELEADVCRSWLVSEAGRQCKTENAKGYQNILLHMKAHIQAMQVLQSGGGGDNSSQPPSPGPNPSNNKKTKPIVGQTTNAETSAKV
jgi:hypothetical protein